MGTQQINFPVRGMTCASSTERIQAGLSRVDGVVDVRVNYATERARVVYDPARTRAARLVAAVRASGFDVPLQHATAPLRAIGNLPVSRDALVDARINWRTRQVEIDWLASEKSAALRRPSLFGAIALLVRSLRPAKH